MNNIRKEVERYRWKNESYWKLVVSLYSIFYGVAYLVATSVSLVALDPVLRQLPQEVVGWSLLGFALIFLIDIFAKNDYSFTIGLAGLSFVWGGLLVTGTWYAFTEWVFIPFWLDKLLILTICLKIREYRYVGGQ